MTLAGDNSFTGAVNIYGGKISALNQSISSSRSINVHKGDEFEVLNTITYKTPSAGGFVSTTKTSDATQVNATINKGGAFVINDGAHNLNLTFKEGSDGLGVSGPLRELVGAQGDGEVPLALRDAVVEVAGRLGADIAGGSEPGGVEGGAPADNSIRCCRYKRRQDNNSF